MKILKSYKFRLKPTEEQIAMLKQHGGNTRFVWNKLLEYSNKEKERINVYPTQSQLQKLILTLKQENKFLKISHSQPLQINAQKLVKTFIKAFKPETISARNKKIAIAKSEKDEELRKRKLAKALNFGFPKFKSKNKNNDNLFYPQYFEIGRSRISFPKLGWINYIKHREVLGKPLFVTITQDGGDQYYVSITTELKIKEKTKPNLDNSNIIGIDVGLKNFAVFSDGNVIENPKTLKKNLKKLRKENKSLSRKEYDKITKKTSNNRIKQISKVQKVHRKIRNIRKEFLHQLTHHIITKYDGVILEDLDIQGLLQKEKKNDREMNRSISDVSWFEFGRQLEYKSIWNSKYFCKVDSYFPSTQLCSKCGRRAKLLLEDRVYFCEYCNNKMDRDYNSSLNLHDEGMRILNQSTLATKGIKACGSGKPGMKQEQVVANSAWAFAKAV